MAKNKYHNLEKRGKYWHFRVGDFRLSLRTTVATEAIRIRDKLLENKLIYGDFQLGASESEELTFGQIAKKWAEIHEKNVKYTTWRDYRSAMNTHVLPVFKDMPIKQIASELGTSPHTVRNQRTNILRKLNGRDDADLVRLMLLLRFHDSQLQPLQRHDERPPREVLENAVCRGDRQVRNSHHRTAARRRS